MISIKTLCTISDRPGNKTSPATLQRLHDWLGDLKVHKSHYSRGKAPLRQFLDHGLNINKLHSLCVNDAIRGEFEAVQLRVFRNVFNNIYNITTRYVCSLLFKTAGINIYDIKSIFYLLKHITSLT